MKTLNQNVPMRRSRRSAIRRHTTFVSLAAATLVGTSAAGWLPAPPHIGRPGGGWTGTQEPAPGAALIRVFQYVRALAIVDQFPPAVIIAFEAYFTEWYLTVSVDDRTTSFQAFITSKGIKNPNEHAMLLALYEIAMRVMQVLGL